MEPTWQRLAVAAALASCSFTAVAFAHAPTAVAVSIGPDAGVAITVPGFGLVIRSDDSAELRYACNDLLDIALDSPDIPLLRLGDGSLLIGREGGLSLLSPGGCPGSADFGELSSTPIAAVAAAADLSTIYVITAGQDAAVHRSTDGGAQWELRGTLPGGDPVTAAIVGSDDPSGLYLSQTGESTTRLLASDDGGATFTDTVLQHPVILLHAEGGTDPQLWGGFYDPETRDTVIVAGQRGDDAWPEVQRLRFFGGFAADPGSETIWLADEAGGLFRSTSSTGDFVDIGPELAVSCLFANDAGLWACSPGLPGQVGLLFSDDDGDSFAEVLLLTDAQELVDCAPDIDVEVVCAAAWGDWQLDVINAGSDAGTYADGDASVEPATRLTDGGWGCTVAGPGSHQPMPGQIRQWTAMALLLLLCSVMGRRYLR